MPALLTRISRTAESRLRTRRVAELCPEAIGSFLALSQIGPHCDSLDAQSLDIAHGGFGGIRISGVVHTDQPGTFLCKGERDRPSNTP